MDKSGYKNGYKKYFYAKKCKNQSPLRGSKAIRTFIPLIAFIIRRLLAMIPLLFGISLLVFFLMYLTPGDFLDEARSRPDISDELVLELEKQYGLKDTEGNPRAWYIQYAYWLNGVSPLKFIDSDGQFFNDVHFGMPKLGQSWAYNIPVTDLIAQRLPATLILSICALSLAWLVAIPMGILAALYKDSIFDRISALFAYAAISLPEFFLAVLGVYFAAKTGWLPTGGRSSIGSEFMSLPSQFGDYAYHLILPTLILGLGGVAGMMRIMRSNYLDYMRADFVTTARAKGLSPTHIHLKHVLRNAINPLITAFGFAFSGLLSGALLVENVLNYPGLGQLLFEAFMRQDAFVVMAAVIMGCVMLMLGNLLADLLLAWTDPRIRLDPSNKDSPTHIVTKGKWSRHLIAYGISALLIYALWILPWDGIISHRFTLPTLKIVGLLILIFTVFYILRSGWTLLRKVLPGICKRPTGLIALSILFLLYFGALFAPFLAPYSAADANLQNTFHPPTKIFWKEGQFHAQLYENVDPSAAQYEALSGQSVPINLFAKGSSYKLFGLIPCNIHLFQADWKKIANPTIEADPKAYPIYLLGSDSTGRDVFSRLLYGSQISLSIGLIGISITMLMGFLVGGFAGYFGGRTDFFAMRFVEFLMAIPGLYLLLSLRSALAPYFESAQMYTVIIIILSLIGWAGTARIIRGMSLSIRRRPYVLAAENMGQSSFKILTKHLLPNLASYLLVAATLSIPGYILGEAALSFLGLGIQEPAASWGLMLKQAQGDMKVLMLGFWWLLTPGLMIFLTVIAFNLLGDSLRDIVDPKMRRNQ